MPLHRLECIARERPNRGVIEIDHVAGDGKLRAAKCLLVHKSEPGWLKKAMLNVEVVNDEC
jgi:hypothetical protein